MFSGNRKRTPIVVMLGPVGVGKSTQLTLLKKYFNGRKSRTTSTYIKSNHVFSYILRNLLVFMGCSEKFTYPDGEKVRCPKRHILRRLLPLVAFLDAFSISIKFFFEVFIPFHFGFVVLIEEGPIMTSHTYHACYPEFFDTNPYVVRLSAYLLGWILSKAHAQIVLDATDNELVQRRRGRDFRRTELPEYVISQRNWMQNLNFKGTFRIETRNKTIYEVHREVVNVLGKI